ncbi:signal recognition particle 19 kDa protein-like isoform X1 [Brassica napus]|uniref:signal recognition particle 19 kDa protein-like isoform X1 n=1 Tax=Brassica napus TaxID=3708 RepID=UPI00207A6CB2|nr:signal recognition particle 19 kDa protein-like isoform X1 [Brassica napus]
MAVLVKINRRSNVSEFFSFVALPQRYSDQQQSPSQKLEFGIQYLMDGGTLNIKKWVVMYPVYINSKKSVAEGRRISLSKACENPNCIEITDCCKHLKLPSAVEIDKAYPRDFMQVGRVRVQLKREDGTLLNPAITSRKQLMQKIADLVPRHPERVKKQESQKVKKQELQATTLTAGTSSKSGKGGKKKR